MRDDFGNGRVSILSSPTMRATTFSLGPRGYGVILVETLSP